MLGYWWVISFIQLTKISFGACFILNWILPLSWSTLSYFLLTHNPFSVQTLYFSLFWAYPSVVQRGQNLPIFLSLSILIFHLPPFLFLPTPHFSFQTHNWVLSPPQTSSCPKEMETSSIIVWKIPWTEEPGGLVHRVAKSQTLSIHLLARV